MKKAFIISLILSAFAISSYAKSSAQFDWKEKILSEKIAFLTMEMGITPEEAQVFWPVYNQIDKERDQAVRQVFETFKALEEAVSTGKSQKEVSKRLDAYTEALEAQNAIENNAVEKYKKVLPMEKLAKLYVGEEKFRRLQIRKLHPNPAPMQR